MRTAFYASALVAEAFFSEKRQFAEQKNAFFDFTY